MSGALLPAEQRLIDHAGAGTRCVLDGAGIDQRRVRSEILYGLLAEDKWRLHPRGVRLCGAVIDELLDAEHTALNAPLVLELCELRAGFTFHAARATAIELIDCRIVGAPDASQLHAGSLRLHGSLITAHLALTGAVIDGDLDLEHLQVLGADTTGTAVLADQLRVGGGASAGSGDRATSTGRPIRTSSSPASTPASVTRPRSAGSASPSTTTSSATSGRPGFRERSPTASAGGRSGGCSGTGTGATGRVGCWW